MLSLKHYLLILAISFLPVISIFNTPLMPHTHDGPVHLARMAAYFKAITGGQILPRWASDLNYGYGMPLFNFIYHTPYLIGSLFLSLGFGLVITFKLVVTISYLLSGVFMLAAAQEIVKDNKKALLITLLYQFAPFRLVEMNVRGSLGEIYTYAFLPLIVWGIMRANLPIIAIATALLIISHNSISLVFFIIIIGLAFILAKNSKSFIRIIATFTLGLMLSAFYWLPAILERRFTYGDLFMKDVFREHFPPLINFFLPNLTNTPALNTGDISVQFGIFHLLALIAAISYLFKIKRADHKLVPLIIYSLGITAVALFFMQPLSTLIWEKITILRQFQFPWRLLSVSVLTTSLVSPAILNLAFFRKKLAYFLLLFLIVFTTTFYWRPSLGLDEVNENYFWNYPLNTTYFGETDLIWSASPPQEYPQKRVEIIEGQGAITDLIKNPTRHSFTVLANNPVRIVDRTQYFPGWRVYIDRQKTPIQFQDANWRGLITFSVPTGTHKIEIAYTQSKIQLLGNGLTVLGLILMIPLWIVSRRKKIYA